jgi:IS30 family transposase
MYQCRPWKTCGLTGTGVGPAGTRGVVVDQLAAAASIISALTRHVRRLPKRLRRSITWDQGKGMSKHASFSVNTDVKVYYCDPHSPWQRGSNENTNGLLRQYFPRGTDLSGYTQSQLDKVALRLNQRPRKTLGFETPADKLHACVASTD